MTIEKKKQITSHSKIQLFYCAHVFFFVFSGNHLRASKLLREWFFLPCSSDLLHSYFFFPSFSFNHFFPIFSHFYQKQQQRASILSFRLFTKIDIYQCKTFIHGWGWWPTIIAFILIFFFSFFFLSSLFRLAFMR